MFYEESFSSSHSRNIEIRTLTTMCIKWETQKLCACLYVCEKKREIACGVYISLVCVCVYKADRQLWQHAHCSKLHNSWGDREEGLLSHATRAGVICSPAPLSCTPRCLWMLQAQPWPGHCTVILQQLRQHVYSKTDTTDFLWCHIMTYFNEY